MSRDEELHDVAYAEPEAHAASKTDESPVAIVGIGASASNVRTIERLFAHTPRDAGLSYVIVAQSRNSFDIEAVREVAARQSGMPASVATGNERLRPNHIYVAPSDTKVSMEDDHFHLEPAAEAVGDRGTIDTFLVSLSDVIGQRAIGVVLQGLGSDGVLGAAALKETGGLAVMEANGEEDPAEQPRTPAGLADFVLPVEQIVRRIVEHARHLREHVPAEQIEQLEAVAGQQIPKIAAILRNRTSHDFHGYKANTFMRRVQRRMNVVQIDEVNVYVERLRRDPDEVDHLFQDLLIGVTQFFRDPAEFEAVRELVIP